MKNKPQNHKGFVILFTILISTIILMIGLGIFSIATREIVLSGTAREAQQAFYAADAGIECALYAQSLPGTPLVSGGGYFSCGADGDLVQVTGDGTPSTPFVFTVFIDDVEKTCARVSIFDIAGAARRVISQGYNLCTSDGQPSQSPLLTERDLDTTYLLGAVAPDPTTNLPAAPSGI